MRELRTSGSDRGAERRLSPLPDPASNDRPYSDRPPAASRCCARKLAARSFPRRPPA
jgi:hypothetical protein